jgi:hypothetical protein
MTRSVRLKKIDGKLPKDKERICGKREELFKPTEPVLLEIFTMSMKKMDAASIGYVLGYSPTAFFHIRDKYPIVEYVLTSGRAWGNKIIADILWTMLKEKNAPIVALFAKACMGMGSAEDLARLLPQDSIKGKVTDINFGKMDAQEASRVYQDLMKQGSKK